LSSQGLLTNSLHDRTLCSCGTDTNQGDIKTLDTQSEWANMADVYTAIKRAWWGLATCRVCAKWSVILQASTFVARTHPWGGQQAPETQL
jgi:hypothetical protein